MQIKTLGGYLERLGETRCACRWQGLHSGAHGWNRLVWKKHEPLPKVNHRNVYRKVSQFFKKTIFCCQHQRRVQCHSTSQYSLDKFMLQKLKFLQIFIAPNWCLKAHKVFVKLHKMWWDIAGLGFDL